MRLHRLQVRAARDEAQIPARLGKPSADETADTTGSEACDSHVRLRAAFADRRRSVISCCNRCCSGSDMGRRRRTMRVIHPWYKLGYVIPHAYTDMDAYQFYAIAP